MNALKYMQRSVVHHRTTCDYKKANEKKVWFGCVLQVHHGPVICHKLSEGGYQIFSNKHGQFCSTGDYTDCPIAYHYSYSAVVNVVDGLFSKTTTSDGLKLKAPTFQPIHAPTTAMHIKNSSSVFFHYGITFGTSGKDFYNKLQVNLFNAGSLAHTGNQMYKTATGFWMENLNPGQYTIEVYYKSPVNVVIPAWDWQAAVLHVFWAENSRAVSSGIKCYPEPTSILIQVSTGVFSMIFKLFCI